jgi:hypothetical protein
VLLLPRGKNNAPQPKGTNSPKAAICAITGKVVLITFFEEFAANGLKTPRSLRGETHSAGAARPQTLSHATKLLQLCRGNVTKAYEEKKTSFGVQALAVLLQQQSQPKG